MKKLLLIFIVTLNSCTQFSSFKAQKIGTQKITLNKGREIIHSNKQLSFITITPPTLFSSREEYGRFYISYKNKSQKPISFSTKNVRVFVNGEEQRIFTYKDLYKKIIKKEESELFWTQLSLALQAQNNSNIADHSVVKSNITNNSNRQIKSIENTLQSIDVKPQTTTGGFLYFNLPFREYQKLKFNIKIFDEIHTIEFDNIKEYN